MGFKLGQLRGKSPLLTTAPLPWYKTVISYKADSRRPSKVDHNKLQILSFFWRILQLISQLQKFETSVAKNMLQKFRGCSSRAGRWCRRRRRRRRRRCRCLDRSPPNFFALKGTEVDFDVASAAVSVQSEIFSVCIRLWFTFAFWGPFVRKFFSLSLLHFVSVWLRQRWIHFLGPGRINAYFIRLQSIAHLSVM